MDLRLLRYFVTVAEEGNVGRAAARLDMTQPPLSRAIRRLEHDLGVQLLERTPRGVTLTAAGSVLCDEARTLLEHADRLRARIADACGAAIINVGTLADTAEQLGATLVAAFRRRQPHVDVVVHEFDLGDPTAGLRAGLVDVALTRTPVDGAGISTYVLGSDHVGVVMHDDDPLAGRQHVAVADLSDRRWVQLPAGIDPVWRAYWTGSAARAEGDVPVTKTIQECLQSVLWNNTSALAPTTQALPRGLTIVPVTDREPSKLVVARKGTSPSTLIRSFVEIAAASRPG